MEVEKDLIKNKNSHLKSENSELFLVSKHNDETVKKLELVRNYLMVDRTKNFHLKKIITKIKSVISSPFSILFMNVFLGVIIMITQALFTNQDSKSIALIVVGTFLCSLIALLGIMDFLMFKEFSKIGYSDLTIRDFIGYVRKDVVVNISKFEPGALDKRLHHIHSLSECDFKKLQDLVNGKI